MNHILSLLGLFQSLLLGAHSQLYPHTHPHVDVSAVQDTGLTMGYIALWAVIGFAGSSVLGFFVGKSLGNRRYSKNTK